MTLFTSSLVFLAFFGVATAVSPINLENCVSGSYFVENFIKYECYQEDNVKGYKIIGCQPSNDLTGTTLIQWETFDEKWFKYHCVIDGLNAQYSVKELGCSHNGQVYRHNQEWTSQDGSTAYACQFGKVVKKGCLVGTLLVPLYSVRYVDGEAFYCSQGTEVKSFGNLKGCTTQEGDIIPFEGRAKNGNMLESCAFSFNRDGTVEFKWTQVGCIYSKEVITVNAIQKIGDDYVHCVLNGTNGYISKLMTRDEVEKWLTATKQQWSNIVSGNEGRGTTIKREVPTMAPETTTTTSTTTTTTPVPTTTTTTTTMAPTTTTTTTPMTPTTSPTTTTIPPTTTTSTTTTTTTPAPKTTVKTPVKKCVDLAEDCEKMRIYCHSNQKNAEFLKDAIEKSSVTQKDKSRMLEFIENML
ncbi:hypothetical protein CAEBREN_32369 [Caenorhabditis brenneri]|uniref:Uncharacterized protein n=1 Tax=Caenorhabditis brenneri TaxID=135651 RepID=G0MSG4_CAEBE|nr:hypothetical protein CAEBREN_32369 [Caenorhabditis brenneri]